MTGNDQSRVAERIIAARDPIIVLWMTGCEAIVINPAYKATFKNDDFPLAQTAEVFGRTIENFLEDKRGKREARCFCEDRELKAPISLTHRDCIHEVLWERLMRKFSDYRGQTLTSLPGIEFLLENPNGAGGERRYRVARVHARRLTEYSKQASELGGDLMEVRMLYAGSVVMPVSDHFNDGAHLIDAEALFEQSNLAFVEKTSFLVDRKNQPYGDVETLIDKALKELDSNPDTPIEAAREILAAGETAIKEEFPDEYPVVHMLVEIVFDPKRVLGDVEVLRKRMMALKARLWDAPTVAWPMRTKIEAFLEDRQSSIPSGDTLRRFRRSLSENEIGDLSVLVEPLNMREGYEALLGA